MSPGDVFILSHDSTKGGKKISVLVPQLVPAIELLQDRARQTLAEPLVDDELSERFDGSVDAGDAKSLSERVDVHDLVRTSVEERVLSEPSQRDLQLSLANFGKLARFSRASINLVFLLFRIWHCFRRCEANDGIVTRDSASSRSVRPREFAVDDVREIVGAVDDLVLTYGLVEHNAQTRHAAKIAARGHEVDRDVVAQDHVADFRSHGITLPREERGG